MKLLTNETIAFAYELKCEYGMTYKQIGSIIGVTEHHICRELAYAIAFGMRGLA